MYLVYSKVPSKKEMTTMTFKMNMKPKTLTAEEVDFLEIHFYMIWPEEGLDSNTDLYEFVSQESNAFVRANPSFPMNLVQREFLRLARLER